MKKINNKIISLIFGALIFTLGVEISHAAEDAIFDKKDESFWVLKNKAAFTDAARTLIDDNGEWKGKPPVPEYIKFCEPLAEDDLQILERWLSLKNLKCFAIADETRQPNLKLIHTWYTDLEGSGVDLKKRNLFKLAWLNGHDTLNQIERGSGAVLPEEWVETNRAFQMKDSHYDVIGVH